MAACTASPLRVKQLSRCLYFRNLTLVKTLNTISVFPSCQCCQHQSTWSDNSKSSGGFKFKYLRQKNTICQPISSSLQRAICSDNVSTQ